MLKMGRLNPVSGSGKNPALTLDVCGKFLELNEQKETIDKNRKKLLLADLILVDDSNHSFRIAV